MIRRRSFLKGCGGMVAVPVLGALAPGPALARAQAHEIALAVAKQADAGSAETALRIDRWDSPTGAVDDVWVHIDGSWRANWR